MILSSGQLLSCSGSFVGSASPSGDKNGIAQEDGNFPPEDREVSEPVSVAGAFLHCDEPYLQTQDSKSQIEFHCSLMNESGDLTFPEDLSWKIFTADGSDISQTTPVSVRLIDRSKIIISSAIEDKIGKISVELTWSGSSNPVKHENDFSDLSSLSLNVGGGKYIILTDEEGDWIDLGPEGISSPECLSRFSEAQQDDNTVTLEEKEWNLNLPDGQYKLGIILKNPCRLDNDLGVRIQVEGESESDGEGEDEDEDQSSEIGFEPNIVNFSQPLEVSVKGGAISIKADVEGTLIFESLILSIAPE